MSTGTPAVISIGANRGKRRKAMAAHAGVALKEMNGRFSTFAKATSQVFGAFRSLTDSHPRTVCFQRALRNWWAVAIAVNQG